MRYLLLPLCLAVLLSACGSDEQGKDVPRKNSEPAVAVEPAKPAPQPEPPAAQAEAPAAQPEAVEPKPQAAQKSLPAEPKKAAQRAKPEKAQGKVAQTPPKTKLDLSLPPELAAALDAEDKAATDGAPPILPSFFEAPKSSLNPFQVSGKLLTGELGSEYWNAVEGAELQFEFRR
ncbi:translation initiation factor 2 [Pseudomonas sp. G34]|uniref:translation initiation factor 2 n=1 Tax=Pseudomonas sp. G34 TaxID=3059083 RepID=UPI002808F0D0|nr:translation initiation factor 2 [Pseudomonas sp. G34]MDQ7984770.1 translation initiation factor 2 [Pseudomonas sp. G34]